MSTINKNEVGVLNKWFISPKALYVIKHVVLIVLLLGAIIAGVFILHRDAEKRAKDWASHDTKFFMSADTAMKEFAELQFAKKVAAASQAEKDRLRDLYGEVRNLARTHLKMAVSFHSRYYMVIVLAAMLAVFASAVLLFITKAGWSNTNSYVITTFLVLASAAAFFTGLTNIFKYKENIQANTSSYLNFRQIEYRILSYVAIGTNEKNDTIDVKQFIHSIDNIVQKALAYHLDYDPAAIPTAPSFEDLMKTE